MHSAEMLILRTDADYFLGSLDGVRELGIDTCDEGICFACLDHHHAEVVTLEHLIVCLFEVISLAATLFCQQLCITLTTFTLVVMTQIYYLDAFKGEFQFCCLLPYHLVITEQDRITESFVICLYGSLYHCRMQSFCKDHLLWMLAGCIEEFLGERCLLAHTQTQLTLVFLPVSDWLSCYPTIHRCLSNSRRYFGDKAWINWLWYEILRSEGEVVYAIDSIYDIRNRLLCKVGNSMYCCYLHLFVDGLGINIEGTTEDIREANYVIYLVRMVCTAC